MRHLRDPITGLCSVCGKSGLHDHSAISSSYHDDDRSDTSRSRSRPSSPSSRDRGRKIIYVNSSPTMTEYIDRPGSATSISSTTSERVVTRSRSVSPVQTRTSTRRVVYRNGSRQHYHDDDGCCNNRCGGQNSRCYNPCWNNRCCRRCCRRRRSRRRRARKSFDPEYADEYEDRCCGYRHNETARYGAGTWGKRHCCALGLTLGILALLAGIAVALYFGITAAIAETKRKQAVQSYISSNKVNYVIYGVDQICNTFNNGTATSTIPNCAATTTSIAIATNFAAPTDPSWAIASSATSNMLEAFFVGGWSPTLSFMPVTALLIELLTQWVYSQQII